MTCVIADNIFSPLGQTTDENLQAVLDGRSAVGRHEDARGLLAPFAASLFECRMTYEEMILASAQRALAGLSIDLSRTALILSTTKGAIGKPLGKSACHIATQLGITTTPITVCNACISGLAAILLAKHLLEAGHYDNAIVCGADVQSEFIIAGFQSLKALSPNACRPFDMERTGLNLGEAAATLVLSREPREDSTWCITQGSIHNDACHISTPSKTAEGLYRCLQDIDTSHSTLPTPHFPLHTPHSTLPTSLVLNLHGTATMFNDQMESVAVRRAGLCDVPANGLKGYFGHTMGAAGILETILTMHALDHHILIGTRGYEELGVSGHVNLSPDHRPTDAQAFIKTLAGFGGGNAAILAERVKSEERRVKSEERRVKSEERRVKSEELATWQTASHVRISPDGISLDGQAKAMEKAGLAGLTALYKSLAIDYPKFYKMDALCRLGVLAAEMLLKDWKVADDAAVVFFNRTSSVVSDKKHLASLADESNYFPSPSVFVYTLPNIVLGEIALRHGLHGETSFYVLPERDDRLMCDILQTVPADTLLAGWLDYADDAHFEADIRLLEKR